MRLGLVIALFTMTIAITCMTSAEAAPTKNTHVSIIIDPVCQKSGCIKVKDIYKHDNSTKSISGKFYYSKALGDYYRKPGMEKSLNYYSIYSGKTFVFVDPDDYTMARSKQIILVPSLSEFALKGEQKKEIDFHTTTRKTYEGVWVDSKCSTARVGVAQNIDLQKVIDHLAGGCKSDLNNIKIHTESKTKLNYCGQECQHQKWLKEALEKSKSNLLRP